jgi:hypothetical protein
LTRFDQQADVTEMGAVILAIVLQRPIGTDEYPRHVSDLVVGATEAPSVRGIPDRPGICAAGCWRRYKRTRGWRFARRSRRSARSFTSRTAARRIVVPVGARCRRLCGTFRFRLSACTRADWRARQGPTIQREGPFRQPLDQSSPFDSILRRSSRSADRSARKR